MRVGFFLTDVFMVRLLLFVDFVGINQECLYTDPLIIHLTNIIVWESQPLIQVLTAGLQYPLNAASWDLIFILHHLSVTKPEKDSVKIIQFWIYLTLTILYHQSIQRTLCIQISILYLPLLNSLDFFGSLSLNCTSLSILLYSFNLILNL